MPGRIGDAWVTIHADGSGLDREVASEFDDLDATFEKAGQKNADAYNGGWRTEFEKGLEESQKAFAATQKDMINQNRGFRSQLTKTTNEFDRLAASLSKDFDEAHGHVESVRNDLRSLATEVDRGEGHIANWRDEIEGALTALTKFKGTRGFFSDLTSEFKRVRTATKDNDDETRNWGETIGKLFGKGSRNDFLNILGSFAGVLGSAAVKAGQLGGELLKLAQDGENAGKTISEFFGGAGKSIGGLLGSIGPEAIPVVAALAAALVGLVEIVSLAIGAIVALAGTIVNALVGALGLAAAALLPLVAGIGTVVVGFIALDDAQKQLLKTDLKPITDNLKGLADIAGENIFGNMAVNARLLAPALSALAPLVDNVSAAVRRQIDAFAGLVASGGLSTFFDTLTRDAGGQIDALGAIFRNLFTSITGLFVGLSPVLSDFLDDIASLTGRFSAFVNSVKGQESVTSFFNDALHSVRALGDAVLQSVKFIGDLARAGAKFGGDKLFSDMADQFERWANFLTDPKNQGAIQSWVEDGAKFASTIGDIIVGIGRFIAAIDTPVFRTGVILIFQAIAESIDFVADTLQNMMDVFSTAGGAISGFISGIGKGLSGLTLGFAHFGSSQDDSKKKTDEQKTAVDSAKKSLDDYTKSTAGASAATQQQAADAQKVAGQWFNFGQKVTGAKVSLNDFIRTTTFNTKSLQDFTSNLITAGSKGVDAGLLKHLQDMGPVAAGALRDLATGSQREIRKANAAWESQQRAIEGSTAAIKTYNQTGIDPKTVNIHTSAADAALEALQEQYDKLKDKTVTVTVATRLAAQSKRLQLNPQADGGILYGPTAILAGEAGPEAVVPLDRPLSQVDPSVRALSAFAQGKSTDVSANARPVAQTVIESGAITVITPASDAKAVALETLNYVVAQGY